MLISRKDFVGGVLFALLGAGVILGSLGLDLGTARRLGPGYFPLIVGTLIAVLGLVLAIKTARQPMAEDERPVDFTRLRPLFWILASVLAFAFLIRPFGVVVSVMALVCISRLSQKESRIVDTLATAAVLSAIASLIFLYGLGVPLKLWPI